MKGRRKPDKVTASQFIWQGYRDWASIRIIGRSEAAAQSGLSYPNRNQQVIDLIVAGVVQWQNVSFPS